MKKILENKDICLHDDSYTNKPNDTINEKIYKLRKRHKLSRNKFADMLGVTVATINNWERKGFMPYQKNIKKICTVFSVDMEYFTQ